MKFERFFGIQPEAVYPLPASFARKRAKKEHAKDEDDDDDAGAPEQIKKEEPGESDAEDEDMFGKEDESDVRDMKYKLENLCLHSGKCQIFIMRNLQNKVFFTLN